MASASGCTTEVPAAEAAASSPPRTSLRTTPDEVTTGSASRTAFAGAGAAAALPDWPCSAVMYSIGVARPVPRSVKESP